MTYAAFTDDTTQLRPLFRKPNLPYWQDELRYLELEVAFYTQLLEMGIDNTAAWCKPLFRELHAAFSQIQRERLKALNGELAGLRNKQQLDHSTAQRFSTNLENLTIALRQLKTRFFPYIHELQVLTIW